MTYVYPTYISAASQLLREPEAQGRDAEELARALVGALHDERLEAMALALAAVERELDRLA